MQTITTIGLDIAKSVFQVHGVDAGGQVIVRRQLKRRYVLTYFQKLSPCLVGIEACASAHHWSRELQALGHTTRRGHAHARSARIASRPSLPATSPCARPASVDRVPLFWPRPVRARRGGRCCSSACPSAVGRCQGPTSRWSARCRPRKTRPIPSCLHAAARPCP